MDESTGVTIGLDIGTTSVKAVAADPAGSVLASARIDHPVITPSPGVLEHDAALAWRDGVLAAARQVGEAAAATGHRVVGMNVAAMVPSLCAVNEAGMPISPGLLYGDRRAVEAAISAGDPPGRGLSPAEDGEFLRMLRWLAQEYPDAAGYWPAQAVANAALCGVGAIDAVTAMTALPVFDFTGWDEAVCASVGVSPSQLPPVIGGNEPVGTTTALGGGLDGAAVGAGIIDAFAEQMVAGADTPGDVLVVFGATLITWAVVEEWIEFPGLWTVPHTAEGLTLIGGPSNAGGIAKDWAASVLQPASGKESSTPADMDPREVPVFLPHVRGERVPLHDVDRRGGFAGLSVAQGPAQMWRSVHEASGFTIRRNLELAGLFPDGVERIVATGGGSADPQWMQAVADATALPVHTVAEHKGAALGSAYVARAAAGIVEGLAGASDWARSGGVVEPDPRWRSACDSRYELFAELSGPPYDPTVSDQTAAGDGGTGSAVPTSQEPAGGPWSDIARVAPPKGEEASGGRP